MDRMKSSQPLHNAAQKRQSKTLSFPGENVGKIQILQGEDSKNPILPLKTESLPSDCDFDEPDRTIGLAEGKSLLQET